MSGKLGSSVLKEISNGMDGEWEVLTFLGATVANIASWWLALGDVGALLGKSLAVAGIAERDSVLTVAKLASD